MATEPEPVYRLESSRNRETGGVGLGMSIACHNGGEVVLASNEPGLKAVFVLPRS